jgi:hypothetical protein
MRPPLAKSHRDIALTYQGKREQDWLLQEPGKDEIIKSLLGQMSKNAQSVTTKQKDISAASATLEKLQDSLKTASKPRVSSIEEEISKTSKKLSSLKAVLLKREALSGGVKGARILNTTLLPWHTTASKNVDRDFKPIAMACAIEDINARKGYRASAMTKPGANIRDMLSDVLEMYGKMRVIVVGTSSPTKSTKWKWWDELEVKIDIGTLSQVAPIQSLLEESQRENKDNMEIQRLITHIEQNKAAKYHPGKGKRLSQLVAPEVAQAITKHLLPALRLNSARTRVREHDTSRIAHFHIDRNVSLHQFTNMKSAPTDKRTVNSKGDSELSESDNERKQSRRDAKGKGPQARKRKTDTSRRGGDSETDDETDLQPTTSQQLTEKSDGDFDNMMDADRKS